ncbi:MAG: alpha-L-fucosidase [Planctomycetota bacterium]
MISTSLRIVAALVLAGSVARAHDHLPVTEDADAPHPAVAPALQGIDAVVADGPFEPAWESLGGYEIPQWYKDAKFGIFIHWGAYSVPAHGSEWYPRMMYLPEGRRGRKPYYHHLEKYGPHQEFGYKDFIPQFKAENFEPDAWADLFAEAGARYVVPVAEHHDGFPMYDCAFTDWDASQMGPKRDVIAELSASVRAKGMKFGVSSHRAFNWCFYVRRDHERGIDFDTADPRWAGLYGRPLPFLFEKGAANYRDLPMPDEQFKDDWLARTCEMVDKYDPDIVWFDFRITSGREVEPEDNSFSPHLRRFAAYYYNKRGAGSADLGVINYKWKAFPEEAAVLDLERSKMDDVRYPFWQTDTAVSSSSWGYTENQKYKTPDRLVDDLVDIVSKNGCLLLNVGPRADGTIPEPDQLILRAIGRWLKVNGEAIYETTPYVVYGEGPTETATGHLSESKNKPFTAGDVRFTAKGETLYATVLGKPDSGVTTIRTLKRGADGVGEVTSVVSLATGRPVAFEQTGDGLVIEWPASDAGEFAWVFKID